MRRLADLPIAGKLMLATVLPAALALLLAGAAIIAYENFGYREQKLREISVQAEILAQSVGAALEFNDAQTVQHYLNALGANPEILAAAAYGESGKLVAAYARPGAPAKLPPAFAAPGQRFEDDELLVFWTVKEGGRRLGGVHLRAGLESLSSRLLRYGGILLAVMFGALLVVLPLARSLHAVIANPIREMAAAARKVANGDMTVRLAEERQRRDEIGVLLESFGQMLARLREMSRQLAEVGEILVSATADILASAMQVASASAQTAAAVGQTGATVDEVKQTARLAALKAAQVSENTQRTAQTSQQGRNSVEEAIAAMGLIQEQMAQIAESIVRLSEQGLAIGEIIATVGDLAEQSNMLAVNAAIEAAKVGEAGKGFAVVAQEVKSLAEQSKQATAQVRTILGEIQKATSGAVLATEQGSKTVDAGVRQSAEAGTAIRVLAQSIDDAVSAATQIAVSAQQQQVGMDQVAQAMHSIREASAQNAASTRQTEEAAQKLHELGLRLKALLERYRV